MWICILEQIMASQEDYHMMLLGFCHDILKGLGHLHQMLEIPFDLGTRTCQVSQGMSIKVNV